MCGLVGCVGVIGFKEKKAFTTLLMLDTIRGHDSTGVVFVTAKGDASIVKKVGTPWDLLDSKEFEIAARGDHRALIGHNRWATKGKVNSRNAHPFEHGNIFGAHNGTLHSQANLEDSQRFEVDSENIFYDMSINGADETIPKLNGAYALTWFDEEDQTVNFIRNDKRPLYFTRTTDNKNLFWASEAWMLTVALSKAEVAHGQIIEVDLLTQYSQKIPGSAFNSTLDPILRTTHKEFAYKVQPTTNYGYYGTTTQPEKKSATTEMMALVGKQLSFSVAKQGKSNSGQWFIEGDIEGSDIKLRCYPPHNGELWKTMMASPNLFTAKCCAFACVEGGYVTINVTTIEEIFDAPEDQRTLFFIGKKDMGSEEQWRAAVSCGCSWCGTVPVLADADDLVWLDKEFVCSVCTEDTSLKDYIAGK